MPEANRHNRYTKKCGALIALHSISGPQGHQGQTWHSGERRWGVTPVSKST